MLSEETIKAVSKLGEVLQEIHNRLISEGKVVVRDGKVIFIENNSV